MNSACSAAHDAPLVEHADLVGMKHRGNALGHDDLRVLPPRCSASAWR